MGRWARGALGLADGRAVATGSVFSTILLSRAVRDRADRPGVRVADVGCGPGPYRELFDAGRYVGVDRAVTLDGVIGDASALPLRGATFDTVLCTEVIEHVPDERRLASELARIATPGAQLILTSPFAHGPHELPHDFRRLTAIGLVATLDAAGWEVVHIEALGGPVVVALDGVARWFDSTSRRLARRLRPGRAPAGAWTAASRRFQQTLAGAVLANPRSQLGPFEVATGGPRLTLGYVVVATRRPGS